MASFEREMVLKRDRDIYLGYRRRFPPGEIRSPLGSKVVLDENMVARNCRNAEYIISAVLIAIAFGCLSCCNTADQIDERKISVYRAYLYDNKIGLIRPKSQRSTSQKVKQIIRCHLEILLNMMRRRHPFSLKGQL